VVESILTTKPKPDANSKAFSILENQSNILGKWKDKLEIPNQGKANKNKTGITEIGSSFSVVNFNNEATDRYNRLRAVLNEDLLSRQFRNSEIFLESDSNDGSLQ